MPCQIHAAKTASKEELAARAKVTEPDARAAALAALKVDTARATVAESELEVERGCLVYSYDIRVAGEKGVREVLVDAGNGKVLKTEHEFEAGEKKEKAGKP
jgi:uncharacterized membrane protein YkoI